jgi:hypothetical protein
MSIAIENNHERLIALENRMGETARMINFLGNTYLTGDTRNGKLPKEVRPYARKLIREHDRLFRRMKKLMAEDLV